MAVNDHPPIGARVRLREDYADAMAGGAFIMGGPIVSGYAYCIVLEGYIRSRGTDPRIPRGAPIALEPGARVHLPVDKLEEVHQKTCPTCHGSGRLGHV